MYQTLYFYEGVSSGLCGPFAASNCVECYGFDLHMG